MSPCRAPKYVPVYVIDDPTLTLADCRHIRRSGEEVAASPSKKVKPQAEKATDIAPNQTTSSLCNDSVTPEDNGSSPLTLPPSTPDRDLPAFVAEPAFVTEGPPSAELCSKNSNGGLVDVVGKELEKEVVDKAIHARALQASALPKEEQAIVSTQEPRVLTAIPFISFLGNQAIETPMVTLPYAFPQAAAQLLALDIYEPKTSELVNLAMVNPEKVSKDVGASTGARSKLAPPSPAKNKARPMSNLVYGSAVRPYGDEIYDGRAPFKMEKYQKLPRIYTEIACDVVIVAVFSLSWWGSGATQISFNIQDIILLADVDFTEPEGPRVPSKPLWLVQPEEEGGIGNGDDASSSEDEGQLV
ncbi:hypothetical protein DXG01_002422 [Tephrocybe rancida]|nr:hypothetical protein DXG01_002422 [Tephrocybe rancida]